MEIHPIQPKELDSWLKLRLRLWPDHDPDELKKDADRILGSPERNGVLVAALPGGKIAGFIEVSLREWAEGCSTSPVGYIEGWYVQPDHRLSGVGKRLVRAAEDWARALGCQEMASDAELGNEASRLAHLALGYGEAARLICFAKKLIA
jgi:aminoglycoside 6'-N-acetyltransferase I